MKKPQPKNRNTVKNIKRKKLKGPPTEEQWVNINKQISDCLKNNEIENKYKIEYEDDFLYIIRTEGVKSERLGRLAFWPEIDDMMFEIFHYSNEEYYDDMFPGDEYLDGSIDGAIMAIETAFPL